MLLFAWLSGKPGNSVVYYPNRILKGMDPGSKTRNPFTWISEALSSTEKDILSVSGVDTAVYFVFLATGLFLTSLSIFLHFSSIIMILLLRKIAQVIKLKLRN